jgi:hypothetical protein
LVASLDSESAAYSTSLLSMKMPLIRVCAKPRGLLFIFVHEPREANKDCARPERRKLERESKAVMFDQEGRH